MPPDSTPPIPTLSRRGLYIAGISAAIIGVVIVVVGITTRKIADAKLQEWTETQAVPVVAVTLPDTRGKTTTFSLPGRLEAYTQAQIYARVTGYVKDWKADIGTPVKAGQLLAEIDAPDLDQQIMQAEANLASAKANSVLADMTLTRGQSLIKTYAISQQDLDQRAADASNKQGLVRAAQANLDRLRVLEQYKRLIAPFDGLVTARTTDIGALINAGGGGGRRCSWFRKPAACASTSMFRRATCPISRSAPKRRSRCPSIRGGRFRRRSRRRHRPLTLPPARPGCSLSSTTRTPS